MAKDGNISENGVARRMVQPFLSEHGVARKIEAAWVSENGYARQWWPNLPPVQPVIARNLYARVRWGLRYPWRNGFTLARARNEYDYSSVAYSSPATFDQDILSRAVYRDYWYQPNELYDPNAGYQCGYRDPIVGVLAPIANEKREVSTDGCWGGQQYYNSWQQGGTILLPAVGTYQIRHQYSCSSDWSGDVWAYAAIIDTNLISGSRDFSSIYWFNRVEYGADVTFNVHVPAGGGRYAFIYFLVCQDSWENSWGNSWFDINFVG